MSRRGRSRRRKLTLLESAFLPGEIVESSGFRNVTVRVFVDNFDQVHLFQEQQNLVGNIAAFFFREDSLGSGNILLMMVVATLPPG